MTTREDFRKFIQANGSEFQNIQTARLGDLSGDVETGTPGLLWARQWNGKEIRVINRANVPSDFDLRVLVGSSRIQPGLWFILLNMEDYLTPAAGGRIGYHHAQHEFGGADQVMLDRRQTVQLSAIVADAAGFTVQLYGAVINTPNGPALVDNEVLDFSSHVPDIGAVFVTIEVDDDGAVSLHEGTAFASPVLADIIYFPTPDPGKYPLYAVLLQEGMTELSNDLISPIMPVGVIARSAGLQIHEADADTPLAADEWGFWDVVDGVLKKITWEDFLTLLNSSSLFKTIATNGVWSWFMDPRAIYFNNKTYFGTIESDGDVVINSYDHITKELGTPFTLHAAMEVDDHDAPAILIRNSDKRVLLFYAKHTSTPMYVRISTNPEDVTAFGSETNLASSIGKSEFSYSQPIQLIGETNEPIYLFSRDHTGGGANRWFYSKSTNGGSTWGAAVDVYTTPTNRSGYFKAIRNGTDRIDFFVSDGHPLYDTATSVYHFYYQGGSYYKTDGTLISASLPLTPSDITQIYDGSTNESWIWDLAIGPDGNPVVVFAVFVGGSSDHRYYYGRWNGSSWVTGQIATAGGGLYSPEVYYSGGVSLDHEDPSIVWASRYVGSQWEIYRYKTYDHGATWASVAITSASTVKNIRPIPVYNHGPEIAMLWLKGTYTTYTNYSMLIRSIGAWDDITPPLAAADDYGSGTPGSGDKLTFWNVTRRLFQTITWANFKAALKIYFDTLYSAIGHTHTIFNDGEGNPADVTTGSAADGTSTYAARRDHVHHIDPTSLGQYRQFVYEVSGGDFSFIIDEDGNPVMALEDLE